MRDFFRWCLLPFLVGLVFGFMHAAHGQEGGNNLCASYLGMCSKHWPCSKSLRVFQGLSEKRVGWLADGTFGTTCTCPKRFLALPGKKVIRVQLLNGTCFPERGRRCGRRETFYAESIRSADRKLARGDKRLLARIDRALKATRAVVPYDLPDTIKLAGLCLECPLGANARLAILQRAKTILPDFVFVDSVLTQKCLPGLVCEKHGFSPRCNPAVQECLADTDGDDFRTMDGDRFLLATTGFVMACLWSPSMNCLDESRSSFEPPPTRTHCPTQGDFEALRYWLLEGVVRP
jgi:hypothetical protein